MDYRLSTYDNPPYPLECIDTVVDPPSGFYNKAGENTYQPCSVNFCKKCSVLGNDCQECKDPSQPTKEYHVYVDLTGQFTCIDNCGTSNTYKDGFICKKCPSSCSSCSSTTTCTSCPAGKHLYFNPGDGTTSCVDCSLFPNHFIGDTDNKHCRPCSFFIPGCVSCASSSECSDCSGSMKMKKKEVGLTSVDSCVDCQSSSTKGVFVYGPSNEYCGDCLENCQSCSSSTDCVSCRSGFRKVEISSNTACSPCSDFQNFYESSVGECLQYDTSCKSCSNAHSCEECTPNLLKVESPRNSDSVNCVTQEQCEEGGGRFVDKSQSTCLDCLDHCDECSSKSDCLKCTQGYFLVENNSGCVSECPEGMTLSQDKVCRSNRKELEPKSLFFLRELSTLMLEFEVDLSFESVSQDFVVSIQMRNSYSKDLNSPDSQENSSQNNTHLKVKSVFYRSEYKTIEIMIEKPPRSLLRETLVLELLRPKLIKQKDDPSIFVHKTNYQVESFTYLTDAEQAIARTSQAGSRFFSVVSIFSSVVSFKYSMQMNRLYQLFEYPLMLNLEHPRRMIIFLEWFNKGSLTDYLPKVFEGISNDHCQKVGTKFREVEYQCQFLRNVGFNLLLILFVISMKVLLQTLVWGVKKIENYEKKKENYRRSMSSIRVPRHSHKLVEKNQRSNLTRRMTIKKKKKLQKTYTNRLRRIFRQLLELRVLYYVITGTQLEIYFSIFINMKYYKSGDPLGNLNLVISISILVILICWLTFLVIKNNQMIKSKKTKDKFGQIKMKKYKFLVEDVDIEKHFGAYFNIYQMVKDLALAIIVVLLYDYSWLQIVGSAILVVSLSFLQHKIRPLKSGLESFCTRVELTSFAIVNTILAISLATEKAGGSKGFNEKVGYPLIIILIAIVISNTAPVINSIRIFIRDAFCLKKKNKNEA